MGYDEPTELGNLLHHIFFQHQNAEFVPKSSINFTLFIYPLCIMNNYIIIMLTSTFLRLTKMPVYFFCARQLSQADLLAKVKKGETMVIDVRQPQVGIEFIRNCIWMSPQAIAGGWSKILDKESEYVIYEGSNIKPQHKGVSAQLFSEAGLPHLHGTLNLDTQQIKDAGGELYQPQLTDKLIQEGYSLLDVRRSDEWIHGMVDGTVTAYDLQKLAKNPHSLKKTIKYIIHCKEGIRSIIALTLLKRSGYDVKAYTGTWEDIKKSGVKIRQL